MYNLKVYDALSRCRQDILNKTGVKVPSKVILRLDVKVRRNVVTLETATQVLNVLYGCEIIDVDTIDP